MQDSASAILVAYYYINDCSAARLTIDTISTSTLLFQASSGSVENAWYHKYRKLIGTLDIRLTKIVLANYQGSKSHINFAKFFVSNARMLVSMRLESGVGNIKKPRLQNNVGCSI